MLRLVAVLKKRHSLPGLALFLCLCATACSSREPVCGADPDRLGDYRVQTVVDGDTLRLAGGDKVRLVGINTPEIGRGGRPSQPLAQHARAALEELIGPRRRVWLLDGADERDRHGRRLAHPFDGQGRNLTAELLRQGMGFHVAVSPNFAFLDCLQRAESEAATAAQGVWSEPALAVVTVAGLPQGHRGFVRLRGEVTRVSFKSNGWWVQLDGRVGLRLERKVQYLFDRRELEALRGRTVEARGWLVPMDGDWWLMDVDHPSMLQVAR